MQIKIDSRTSPSGKRNQWNLQGILTIHEEIVRPREDGDHMPMLSEEMHISNKVGMQKIILALENKFRKLEITHEQKKTIEAAIKEYKSAFNVHRRS